MEGCIDTGGEDDSGGGGGGGCLVTVAAAATAVAAIDAGLVVAVGGASRGAVRSSRGSSILVAWRALCSLLVRAHCLHLRAARLSACGRAKVRWEICVRRAHMYRETHRPVGLQNVDGDFFADTLVLHVFVCVSARRVAGMAISVCLQAC